ncbi:glycosyltransferase [bacterium]|nr:glycosyltransferase [bacterium]
MFPLIIGIIVFAMSLLILLGSTREWPKSHRRPPVTVVVCARNESTYLMDCLMSLSTQDYPSDRYNIILVNHLSSDDTGELMEYYATYSPVPTKVIHITEEDPELKGKIHAIEVGLSHVQTEHVLLTDADCIVPESWITTMMAYFQETVLAVGGLVTVGRHGTPDTSIARLQNVDHRYYLGMLAGLAGLRRPLEKQPHMRDSLPPWLRKILPPMRAAFCIGNNLAIRMSVYRRIGGYRAIGPTLIEDYALMNQMVKHDNRPLVMVIDPPARVITTPQQSLGKLWHQKRRWGSATKVLNPLSVVMFILVFLIRVVVPWFIFTQPIQTLIALGLMTVGDILVIRHVSNMTGDRVKWLDIFIHEIYQIILNTLVVLANTFNWPVIWKGERYRKSGTRKNA